MKAKITELEDKIRDIRGRMPAHSVKPEMVQMLEDLEEELERLKSVDAEKADAVSKIINKQERNFQKCRTKDW